MARLKTKNVKRRTVIRRLLSLVILAVLLWLFFILGGRALCYIAMQQIAGLTNTEIRTESVDFHTDGSVFITKLVVSPSEEQNGKLSTSTTLFSMSNTTWTPTDGICLDSRSRLPRAGPAGCRVFVSIRAYFSIQRLREVR
jgi:hypothetical protein